jgi:hypothetical protein
MVVQKGVNGASNPKRVDVEDIEPLVTDPSTSRPPAGRNRGRRRGLLSRKRDGGTVRIRRSMMSSCSTS